MLLIRMLLLTLVLGSSVSLLAVPPGYKAVSTKDPDDAPPAYEAVVKEAVAKAQLYQDCKDPVIHQYASLAEAWRGALLQMQGRFQAAPSRPSLACYVKSERMQEYVQRRGAAYGTLARFHPMLMQRLRLLAECQLRAQAQGAVGRADGLTSCGHVVLTARDAEALRHLRCPMCQGRVTHTYSIEQLLSDPDLTEWLHSLPMD